MRQKILNALHERILTYVRTRYPMIVARPIQGLFNFRCFENAVQYARDNPGIKVVEVMLDDGGLPILHFINYDPVKDEYLETTQGWRADVMDYYFIRVIHEEQYRYIGTLFDKSVKEWTRQFANRWYHQLFNIERIV